MPPGLVATRSLHSRTVPAAERAAAARAEMREALATVAMDLVMSVEA